MTKNLKKITHSVALCAIFASNAYSIDITSNTWLNDGAIPTTGDYNIYNGVYLYFNQSNVNADTTYSGTMSGEGHFSQWGDGTVTLSGTNTYTGSTYATGTLKLMGGSAISDVSFVHLSGTLHVVDNETVGYLNGSGNVLLDADLTLDGDYSWNSSFSGSISGTGSLIFSNNTTFHLILSGTNTYTGNTIINNGSIEVENGNAIADNGIVIINNSGRLMLGNDETVGSIQGNGNIKLSSRLDAPANLTTGGNNTDDVFSGYIYGSGTLIKEGTGTLTLNLLGSNAYTGGTIINGGTLKGTSYSIRGDILNNATLEIVEEVEGYISNVISGSGTVIKSGSGVLVLHGANTYTGDTNINDGTLAVTGSTTTSDFIVNSGGTLRGSGNVGDTTIKSGGVLYPTDTSTLNVSGDLTFENGSVYRLDTKSNGTNGKVAVTGTANLDGTVEVKADNSGTWNSSTDYEILTAGTVNSTFDSVSSDLAFLTPTLSYDASSVNLTLTRNSTSYESKGTNSHSASVGAILDNAQTPNADMQTLLDVLDGTNDAGAATMLSQLNGSSLGAISSQNSAFIRNFSSTLFARMSGGGSGGIGLASLAFADNGDWTSIFKHLSDAGAAGENGFADPQKLGEYELWIRAVGGKTYTDGDISSNIYDTTTTSAGVQTGLDKHIGDWIVGVSFGYLSSDMKQSDADADTDSYQLGFYLANETKKHRLSFSVVGGIYDTDATRTLLSGSTNAAYDSSALLAEAKAAYKYHFSKTLRLEPSIGGWVQKYAQDAYTESGAAGSTLSVDKATFNSQAITTELKVVNIFDNDKNSKKTLEASIGYAHEFGDVNAPLVGRFSAAPEAGSFSIASANRGRDVLTTALGGDVSLTQNSRLFALVNASFRENEESYSAMGGVKIGF